MVTIKNSKERVLHRLKIVNGHLNKVIKMIEDDTYCIDVLHQSLAIQKALKQIDMVIMEDHLKHCVVHQAKSGREADLVNELIGIYKFK